MAKRLIRSTKIHVWGDEKNTQLKAFALIGYDEHVQNEPDGSVVILIRGDKDVITKQLHLYGDFEEKDINKILNLKFKETYWADEDSQIIRIA